MPFRRPRMSILLAQREQDAAVRAAVDEARARRDLHLEHLGFPLRTASPTPEVESSERGVRGGRPATSIGSETLETRLDRMNGS